MGVSCGECRRRRRLGRDRERLGGRPRAWPLRRRRRIGVRYRRRFGDIAGVSASISPAYLRDTAGLSTSSIRSASLTSFCSEVMMLPPVKPVAASLTSSKLFLRSAISASRIASWNWPWNSAAILRALPIHCPTMRSTPGNSFGPMAISATTAMTTSSLHPMSNMKNSAHARRFHPTIKHDLGRPRLLAGLAAQSAASPLPQTALLGQSWLRQPCCRHPTAPPRTAWHYDRSSSPARAFPQSCHRPACPS